MNEKLFVLETQKKKTNHILHFLITIFTIGGWFIVWMIIHSINSSHNKKIEKEMNHIVHYKTQGMSDTETHQRIKLDKLDEDARKKMFMFGLIVLIAGLWWWNS